MFDKKDIDGARKLYKEFRKELNKQSLKKEEKYEILTQLAQRTTIEGMFKEAIKIWGKAYLLAPSAIEKIKILSEMTFCYTQLDKYFLAILCNWKILWLSKYHKMKEYYLKALYGFGEIYSFKGNFTKAIFFYKKILNLLSLEKEWEKEIYQKTLVSLFVCYHKQKKYSEAIQIFNLTQKLKLDEHLLMNLYLFRGHMHYDKHEYLDAKNWYQKALEVWKTLVPPTEKLKQMHETDRINIERWITECEEKLSKNFQ